MRQEGHACYQIIPDTKVNFDDAIKECHRLGGEVASFHSKEEQEYLQRLAMEYNLRTFWIGITDTKYEGIWQWLDGTSGTLDFAGLNKSGNTNQYDCIIMGSIKGDLSYTTCHTNSQHGFICKASLYPKKCADGWELIDGQCYAVIKEEASFHKAYMTCGLMGGDLPSILTEEQFILIQKGLSNYLSNIIVWIGLQFGYKTAGYRWTDQKYVAYVPNKLPELGNNQIKCYTLEKNTWIQHKCSDKADGFICQKTPGIFKTCPSGSIRFGDLCYKLKDTVRNNGIDARETCVKMGGDLVVIDSPALAVFIKEFITVRNVPGDYWIGLFESGQDGNYSWVNGHPLASYTNWPNSQPDDSSNYNCVSIKRSTGYKWDDVNCNMELPYICEYYNTPCRHDKTCHPEHGECNLGQCRCRKGYHGDGKNVCIDINECTLSPCDPDAMCTNTNGSFTCKCHEGFDGNGFFCQNKLSCTQDSDCHKDGECGPVTRLCRCKDGYQGNGLDNCVDIDECKSDELNNCHKDATCINMEPGYKCECNEGFFKDGNKCIGTPFDCEMIRKNKPNAKTGMYLIDPDGAKIGGVKAFMVLCKMTAEYAVTIVSSNTQHNHEIRRKYNQYSYTKYIRYTNADEQKLKLLVDNSVFCYQKITFTCRRASLLGTTYYTDIENKRYDLNQCPCGEINSCYKENAQCNCDGVHGYTKYDVIKVTKDDANLPINKMVSGQTSNSKRLWFKVSSLYCGPVQFDIPKDCNEAKFILKLRQNLVIKIDPDGAPTQENITNYPPFLALCDVHRHWHVGITVLRPEGVYGIRTLTTPGVNRVGYTIGIGALHKLIGYSGFCIQELTYYCQNSTLLEAGSSWAGGNTTKNLQYWPSSLTSEASCACGITGTCVDPNKTCNCDIGDGKLRKDFGFVINKEDLPILSLDLKDIGPNNTGAYQLGALQCASKQFGIQASCQQYRYNGYAENYTYIIDPDGPRRSENDINVAPFLVTCEMGKNVRTGCAILNNDNSIQTKAVIARFRSDKKNLHCEEINGGKNLRCCEIFQTCWHIYHEYRRTYGQNQLTSGYYVIDPDGVQGELDPFEVYCHFPSGITTVPSRNGRSRTLNADRYRNPEKFAKPYAYCKKINYHGGVSRAQLAGLVKESGFCRQKAYFNCKHSPFSTHVLWKSNDGQKMKGWAGAMDEPECACGSQDSCDGGPHLACNCDDNSPTLTEDSGYFVNKEVLPVSEVCMGYSNITTSGQYARYYVANFQCAPYQFGISKDCQTIRNYNRQRVQNSGTYIVDSDGPSLTSNKPFTAYCNMSYEPPLGVTVITHNYTDQFIDIGDEGGEIEIKYNSATIEKLKTLTAGSVFCTQELVYHCNNTDLVINSTIGIGWYSVDGKPMAYWGGNKGGTGCFGGKCMCSTHGVNLKDGGLLTDKTTLPVTKLKFASVSPGGSRNVTLGALKCYTVYRNCEDIRVNNAKYNPNRNNRYSIKPDLVDKPNGGVDIFSAQCYFRHDMGITIVHRNPSTPVRVDKDLEPASDNTTILYTRANIEQARALVESSLFCKQKLTFTCKNLPLLNNFKPAYNYFLDHTGRMSRSFSGADAYNKDGCSCSVLDRCPMDNTCRCDSYIGTNSYTEGDILTNMDILPVSGIVTGGTSVTGAFGMYQLGSLQCSTKPWGYPRDCHDAKRRRWITKSGELTIQPYGYVSPFLVYCDLDIDPYIGITIITKGQREKIPVPVKGKVTVSYKGATDKQIQSLVDKSRACYLPIKLDCRATEFIGKNSETLWTGKSNINYTYWGHYNRYRNNKCRCGADRKCGGHDGYNNMRSRSCNCNVGDNTWRADAGIFGFKSHLALKSINFNLGNNVNASAYLTVGDMYCGPRHFDLNECRLGFSDCHDLAYCVNLDGRYDCKCKEGFQALGRPGLYANGRECYDDNECALNPCPVTAECNNTFGSYVCNCRDGFRKTGPTSCADINECVIGTDNCDDNARCYNKFGTFSCVCNEGYRGNGTKGNCHSVGTCKCWGDPHCMSYDQKIMHFQGDCKYVMTRDGCVNGQIAGAPTFEIIQKHWADFKPTTKQVTWVKEVYIHVYGHVIKLKQNLKVLLDDITINKLPSQPLENHQDLTIRQIGRFVVVTWSSGIEVKWSGTTQITVVIPSSYQNTTCGLCGNYNEDPTDDWIIGPSCPDNGLGAVTDNVNTFGHSWTSGNDSDCTKDCNQAPEPECEEQTKQQAETQCKILTDKNGRFKDCIAQMKKTIILEYFDTCVYDMCHTDNDIEAALCENAERLAKDCQELGVQLSWRGSDFCAFQCGENMEYTACGKPCQNTCYTLDKSISCSGPCVETCQCVDGMYLDSTNKCVPITDCGCFVDGVYYSVGDRKVHSNCTHECYCKTPRSTSLECQPLTCHEEATCKNIDGDVDCYCNNGYQGDGKSCTDIDECSKRPKPCHEDARCRNNPGSYTCKCKNGFLGDGKTCVDIDECGLGRDNCDNNATCQNIPGSYKCNCKQGFRKVDGVCVDVDECTRRIATCVSKTTVCNNLIGTYECLCRPGYKRANQHSCTDINECSDDSLNNCHINATCSNNIGGFSCNCITGFKGDGVTTCEDIDECKRKGVCSEKANCTNTVGSYSCTCNKGYKGDGKTCEEIEPDDCLLDCESKHGVNSECVIEGFLKYNCKCKSGYKMVTEGGKTVCKDIDECTDPDNQHFCSTFADCDNTDGSYECTCTTGYKGDGFDCKDIDECSSGNHLCSLHATCTNTEGSYYCTCTDGYNGDGIVCDDIDECQMGDYECYNNSECKNTPGAYICVCYDGYTGHCDDCQDIDECLNNLHNCHPYANCINTEGSFTCECMSGFYGPGTSCTDRDECYLGTDNCDPMAKCVNIRGSFACICMDGFKPNENNTCIDINECTSSENICSPHAKCTNTEGSYKCTCKHGYIGDGYHCFDDDPGLCNNKTCDGNAECKVLEEGVSKCICIEGYKGPGYSEEEGTPGCIPLDPCANKICDPNAQCYAIGTYGDCICNNNYRGDGQICVEIDPCSKDNVCGINAICEKSNNSQRYECVCEKGYAPFDGDSCLDENECETIDDACPDNSYCKNTDGSYECLCDSGYERNTTSAGCTDIDECKSDKHDCDHPDRATCTNEEGSYKCLCQEGFKLVGILCVENGGSGCTKECGQLQYCGKEECECVTGSTEESDDPLICIDIDECKEDNPCSPNADCENTHPGYACDCKNGYTGNGIECNDIDECAQGEENCDDNADCVNEEGSYNCVCKTGYYDDSDGNGTSCKLHSPDYDICGCGLNGICISQTLRCACKPGYEANYTANINKCQDVDECEDKDNCHSAAVCDNIEGGYECTCPYGYVGDGKHFCDKDECKLGAHNCSDKYSICVNTIGYYECFCEVGSIGDGFTCEKVPDPCDKIGSCGNNSYCKSGVTEAHCECLDGYTGDGEKCIDINECKEEGPLQHDCDINAVCLNTEGRYACVCKPGFNGTGKVCHEINECIESDGNGGQGPCSSTSNCQNAVGGYTCTCKAGLQGNGTYCKPVLACGGQCGLHSTCVSKEYGGHLCECDKGYVANDTVCVDKNECEIADDNYCHDEFATCNNTDGGFTCRCNEGFAGDGIRCYDINECLKDDVVKSCNGDNKNCMNTPGSYECTCDEGYQGENCTDINECDVPENTTCNSNAECINKPGKYICVCKDGFYGDGETCTECDGGICPECPLTSIYNGIECVNIDECNAPANSKYIHQCVNADCQDKQPGYTCNCHAGYKPSPKDERICINVDECQNPDICTSHGKCVDLDGSFVCVCEKGYMHTDQGCKNIDECEIPDICGGTSASICEDTEGSFKCLCKGGYKLNEKTGKCEDKDDCVDTIDICGDSNALCINEPGSYSCLCPTGYSPQAGKCSDINECSMANQCNENAKCTNTEGSYTCLCDEGYIGDGRHCSPICGPGACNSRQTCHVVNNRPVCDCSCETAECSNKAKVCGSNGVTYNSYAELIIHACKSGMHELHRSYRGICQISCGETKCSAYKKCSMNAGFPVCECQGCEDNDWKIGKWCSKDGTVYSNKCMFILDQCDKDGNDDPIPIDQCNNPIDCEYTKWSPWTPCSKSCGLGSKSRYRGQKSPALYGGKNCTELQQIVSCYKRPCLNGFCDAVYCDRPGEICVVYGGVKPLCRCNDNCGADPIAPLCGKIGDREVTRPNLCTLRCEACFANEPYEVLRDGRCKDGATNVPLNCTVINHYKKVKDEEGCVTNETVQVDKCSGGCGKVIGKCCEPTKVNYHFKKFICPDQRVKIGKVYQIAQCSCVPDGRGKKHKEIIDMQNVNLYSLESYIKYLQANKQNKDAVA